MNVAAYARKSQGDDAGIEKQVNLAREFAAEKGWTVSAVYTDDGVSGGKLSRPGLDKMLAAMETKPRPFDVIVTMSGDRLSRGKIHETLGLMDRITRAGVQVWSYISKSQDAFLTPEDQLVHGVKGYGYMKFRLDISDKTKSDKANRKAHGWATGPAPYGLRVVHVGPPTQKRDYHHSEFVVDPEAGRRCHSAIHAGRRRLRRAPHRAGSPRVRTERRELVFDRSQEGPRP